MWSKIKLIVDSLTAESTGYLTFTWFVRSDFFQSRRRSFSVCLKYQFRNDFFDRHLVDIRELTSERAVSKNDERNESKSRFDRNGSETIPRRHRYAFVLNNLMTSESGGAVTISFRHILKVFQMVFISWNIFIQFSSDMGRILWYNSTK